MRPRFSLSGGIMKYYHDNGYINMEKIVRDKYPFTFVIHGRGTGKTYGTLRMVLDKKIPFIFMRRTQSQVDLISKDDFSPFKPLMDDDPSLVLTMQPLNKYVTGVYKATRSDAGKLVPEGDALGYICALSTISNLRGFSLENVRILIFDEFIPEKHERLIRAEGDALLNAYETINRNREIKGRRPLQLLCLSNANTISAPIFETLNVIDKIDRMIRTGRQEYFDEARGIAIYLLKDSPISNKKAETSLYKATRETDFQKMALSNEFSSDHFTYIRRQPIEEYRPLATYEDVCIYRHKSNPRLWYISRHKSGSVPAYTSDPFSTKKFRRDYMIMFDAIIQGNVSFEDYYTKLVLTSAL